MNYPLILLISLPSLALCQNVFEIPFPASNTTVNPINTIELVVKNSSGGSQDDLEITATDVPPWIHFTSSRRSLEDLGGLQTRTVLFSFSVDKSAPVNSRNDIVFTVSNPSGQHWTRVITVAVAPPERFRLFQNFPNPFNPTTTIAYDLATESFVDLRVYDLIGQEVGAVSRGIRPPGHHEASWNAAGFPSGIYVYRIVVRDPGGSTTTEERLMALVR